MILKNSTWFEFCSMARQSNKKILVYGAGVIGKVVVPYHMQKYGLAEQILAYVDRDTGKTGQKIVIADREIEILTPEILEQRRENVVLLITNSNFLPVVDALDQIEALRSVEAYIVPIMQIFEQKFVKNLPMPRRTELPVIPKVIHYFWASENPMPDYLRQCVESWKKFCPDYELVLWDEKSYDVDQYTYTRQACDKKKWGYIPDVARLDILYRYGGIYMDTDVELIRNIDELLYQPAFCGVEKWGVLNMGGCSGAVPHHPAVKMLLDYRKDELFIRQDGSLNLESSGAYETVPMLMRGYEINNTNQIVSDMTIYASDYFHPYDYMSGETNLTENTYSIHHFNGGWLNKEAGEARRRTREQYEQILRRMEF